MDHSQNSSYAGSTSKERPQTMKKNTKPKHAEGSAPHPELSSQETAVYHLARANMLHEPEASEKYPALVADLARRGIIALAANGKYLAVSEFDVRVQRRDVRQRSIKVTLPAKVEPEEKAAVEAYAAAENINVSEAVRRIIRTQLMSPDLVSPPRRAPHRRRRSN